MNEAIEVTGDQPSALLPEPVSSETESANASDSHETASAPTEPAQHAPAAVEEVQAELDRARAELAAAKEQLAAAERRHEIDREITAAGAIDAETASMLVETAVARGEARSVAEAVALIRRRKAYLFPASPAVGAMGRRVESSSSLDSAAEEARRAGDRRSLMEYLKVRRADVSAS